MVKKKGNKPSGQYWRASLIRSKVNELQDIEEKLAEKGELDFLEIRIFMTRGWTRDDVAKIFLQDNEEGWVSVSLSSSQPLSDHVHPDA